MSEPTTVHGEPPEGHCCLATMEDITKEDKNYVEFQIYPSMKWKAAFFEQSVVEQLLATQFHDFVNRVKTTDCQAELKRLLGTGPPVWISDKHGFPLDDDDEKNDNANDDDDDNNESRVYKLWYASDNMERSAKLDGAVEGEERQILWDELKQFIIVEGKEEGDDENGENGADKKE